MYVCVPLLLVFLLPPSALRKYLLYNIKKKQRKYFNIQVCTICTFFQYLFNSTRCILQVCRKSCFLPAPSLLSLYFSLYVSMSLCLPASMPLCLYASISLLSLSMSHIFMSFFSLSPCLSLYLSLFLCLHMSPSAPLGSLALVQLHRGQRRRRGKKRQDPPYLVVRARVRSQQQRGGVRHRQVSGLPRREVRIFFRVSLFSFHARNGTYLRQEKRDQMVRNRRV